MAWKRNLPLPNVKTSDCKREKERERKREREREVYSKLSYNCRRLVGDCVRGIS